jgi:hypothetical protein
MPLVNTTSVRVTDTSILHHTRHHPSISPFLSIKRARKNNLKRKEKVRQENDLWPPFFMQKETQLALTLTSHRSPAPLNFIETKLSTLITAGLLAYHHLDNILYLIYLLFFLENV